jgi:hypothetical protein
MVGMVLIFDILHNDFRLITVASWRSKRVYVKALLTHAEYDRKRMDEMGLMTISPRKYGLLLGRFAAEGDRDRRGTRTF